MREIHDTVAQGLSSIRMLLHAADRANGGDSRAAVRRLAEQQWTHDGITVSVTVPDVALPMDVETALLARHRARSRTRCSTRGRRTSTSWSRWTAGKHP